MIFLSGEERHILWTIAVALFFFAMVMGIIGEVMVFENRKIIVFASIGVSFLFGAILYFF